MTKEKAALSPKTRLYMKIAFLVIALLLAFFAGREFYELRHYKETFVASEGLTEVKMLSDYLPNLKGTWADTPIFVFDSGVEGGSVLYMANVHPYEPATSLSAYVMLENISVQKGKVYIIPQGNRSGSTLGMLGNAYPKFFSVETSFGSKKYRIGDRGTNPLDQWPDPFTYVHYPSGQNLAYQDIRNMNRTYPGRKNGSLTERASYAIMELIRVEQIDLSIDVHEASLMYPVVETFVSHDKSFDVATMANFQLQAEFPMKNEPSPKGLRGLSHREWGDYSDSTLEQWPSDTAATEFEGGTLAVLMETPEPFIDRIAGQMTEELMTIGQDEFLAKAAEHGLLYVDYDYEFGSPLWYRVGRHLSSAAALIDWMNIFFPEKEVIASWPLYSDLEAHDVGYFLHDPATADPSLVFEV